MTIRMKSTNLAVVAAASQNFLLLVEPNTSSVSLCGSASDGSKQ
jgi:hypothetical protein